MAQPRALILTGYGINCDRETQIAFQMAGASARRVHVNDLIDGHDTLDRYQILAIPGGFSYGDDIASGKVLANRLKTHLASTIETFIAKGNLVIGICNGFQVMVKYGLLGIHRAGNLRQTVTLTYNDSGRYEDRWVHLATSDEHCVFTRGIKRLHLPVAHGEGKFYTDPAILENLESQGLVALRYTYEDGRPAGGRFPWNPNGSCNDIAGICDTTGRVFGMMPHPERFLMITNHSRWSAFAEHAKRQGRALPEEGEGLQIFRNAVSYFS
jgi:phosphoribosylformylglycinamidine synthase subunit PurQ / glutaminase